jgi:hypothetical protein
MKQRWSDRGEEEDLTRAGFTESTLLQRSESSQMSTSRVGDRHNHLALSAARPVSGRVTSSSTKEQITRFLLHSRGVHSNTVGGAIKIVRSEKRDQPQPLSAQGAAADLLAYRVPSSAVKMRVDALKVSRNSLSAEWWRLISLSPLPDCDRTRDRL